MDEEVPICARRSFQSLMHFFRWGCRETAWVSRVAMWKRGSNWSTRHASLERVCGRLNWRCCHGSDWLRCWCQAARWRSERRWLQRTGLLRRPREQRCAVWSCEASASQGRRASCEVLCAVVFFWCCKRCTLTLAPKPTPARAPRLAPTHNIASLSRLCMHPQAARLLQTHLHGTPSTPPY